MRLWIDTDVGDDPDDVVALACAQAHGDVEVVGVSVVGGRFAERVALARRHVDAPVHEPDGSLPAVVRAARPEALLAIGPLTNLGRLLAAVPDLPLTLMGGVIVPLVHRGGVRTVEHNFGSDPAAASAVLAQVPAVVVPLDVTVGMAMSADEQAHLVAAIPGLDREMERWTARVATEGMRAADVRLVLHDPLALLVCAQDAAADARTEWRALDVDATGRVVDGGRVHELVVHADTARARTRVLQLVG